MATADLADLVRAGRHAASRLERPALDELADRAVAADRGLRDARDRIAGLERQVRSYEAMFERSYDATREPSPLAAEEAGEMLLQSERAVAVLAARLGSDEEARAIRDELVAAFVQEFDPKEQTHG